MIRSPAIVALRKKYGKYLPHQRNNVDLPHQRNNVTE